MITSVGCGRLLPERVEGRIVQNISECVVHQTVASDGGTSDFCQRASPLLVVVVVVVGRFYTELFSTLEQTHSCRIQFWMSDCSFVQRAFEYPPKWHT